MCVVPVFILRDEQYIEFRDTDNLSKIIYTHLVAPHKPGRLFTVGLSTLLYEDQSKEPSDFQWFDCNKIKPKLIKEKSFATPLPGMWDFIRVQNVTDELIIGFERQEGIICYNSFTKSLEWSVAGKLPGMQNAINARCITTDGCGHLFVSDGWNGNRCIQMFSVSDGQYLGCLIKEGEQSLGRPNRISWHSASHSLAVAHLQKPGDFWNLSMINIEY